jgi:hypothetical protein
VICLLRTKAAWSVASNHLVSSANEDMIPPCTMTWLGNVDHL